MTRQKLRKTIILISFLLFPVTLYYFSPYLIIQGASEGIISGSMMVFTLMLIGSLFLGRGFCGWLCPAGGLQECMTIINDKKAKGGKLNWIKYAIWLPWIMIIALTAYAAGGLKTLDFFYQTTNGISVLNAMSYIIYYGVIILVVVLSLTTGRRGFCHYACWMAPFMIIGTKIAAVLKIPTLHLTAASSACVGCKQCTKKCPMGLDVDQMAKSGKMYNAECILCGECIDSCPTKVIQYRL